MGCGTSANTQEPKNKKTDVVKSQPDVEPNTAQQQIDSNTVGKMPQRRFSVDNSELNEIMGNNVPKMLVEQSVHTGLDQSTIEEPKKQPLQKQESIAMMLPTKLESVREIKQDSSHTVVQPLAMPSQGYITSMKELGQDPVQRNQKKAVKKFRGNELDYAEIFENVKRVEKPMEDKDRTMIQKCFRGHFVFFNLSQQALEGLMQQMFYCTIKPGEFIFKQGDQASCYFVIDHGEVEIIIDEKLIRTQRNAESFGELALLYGAQRSASIRAASECTFWALDRTTFKSVLENLISSEQEENRKFIEEVSFFSFMTSQQKDSIAATLITTKFGPGAYIVNEGDRADSYYVIKSGLVSIWKGDKLIRKMGPKDSFGEQALYISSTRGASVKAESEVKCVSLGRDNLTKILGDKVQIIIFNNIMRWSFSKSEILSQLTLIQIEKVAQNAKISNFPASQPIFAEGEVCDKLVIVLEGNIIDQSGKIVYSKGQLFGDSYMLSQNKAKRVESALRVGSDSVMAVITFQRILQLIGGELEQVLKRNEQSHEKKIKNLGDRQDMSHIKVEDLVFIKKLGQGQFGSVYLVQHKQDKSKVYALKSVSKASIIEQSLEKHILQEKAVLEMINFPFIMSFIRTFKDNFSVYFLVEYIKGMELFDVIREIGLLTMSDTQFYIGSMILALEYLHSKQVVYRDIKPENIMIDYKGYMYLIDLGTAKPLAKAKNYRTFTIIGTPHYMAPEIIAAKGYSYHVDLWSVGVCCFEFLCGGVPYAEDADDPYEIYEEIMHTELSSKFPSFFKDRTSKKFIEQLLSKQPEARIGASYASLKAHPWFDDFDWDRLFNKELQPPYVPPTNSLISNKEFEYMYQQGKPVVSEIKTEQQQQKLTYKKEKARDPDWDKDF